jgi:iron complex outermembrane receptor protein
VSALFLASLLNAQSLDTLLEDFEDTSKKSLSTLDEKLGNLTLYSQEDIQRMQYTTLSDLLKEFPLSNLNKNKFGASTLSLSGSKTDVSGFFKVFINDHEISSNYTMTPSASWMDFPMDIVDYVEVYRGNSSFSLGSGDGIFFIRIYTKKASKENASKLFASVVDNGSNYLGFSQSDTFENGWSYLAYLSNVISKDENSIGTNDLENDSDSRYLYLNVQKENTAINFGYTFTDKDNYIGFSLDADPDDGKYISNDAFVDFKSTFLNDNSLKLKLSFDISKLKYDESNLEGIGIVPAIDFTNPVFPSEYDNDTKVIKGAALISKSYNSGDNNFLIGLNSYFKRYTLEKRADYTKKYFEDENKYGLFLQDDYRLLKDLLLVLNLKYDSYTRDKGIDDEQSLHYRFGGIYKATQNLGLKAFYTKTDILPSFYNYDFQSQFQQEKLKTQKYKHYQIESVYADDDLRFSVLYNNVKIDDFVYYTPVGFINIDHTIEADNWVFDLRYELFEDHEIMLNYFTTSLSEEINNSNKGGLVNINGEYGDYSYFLTLIYKNAYSYYATDVDESYNLNIGSTYKISEDISLSLKAENIFDDSTQSLHKQGLSPDPSVGNFSVEDYEPKITISTEWVF